MAFRGYVIYTPRGRAREYAALATNPYRGCGHGCKYCYVPGVLRMSRAEFNRGAVPRPGYLAKLRRDARHLQEAGIHEQVLFSFTTDPYHPGDNTLTRDALLVLREAGIPFVTLTKGGTRALRDLDLFRPEADAFAVTLTGTDPAFVRKWEPNAAPPGDRIAALRAFAERGIYTWVSIEPTLSVEEALAVIEATAPFVDLYKVGVANYIGDLGIDWAEYAERVIEAVERHGRALYLKADLLRYAPAGYRNRPVVTHH